MWDSNPDIGERQVAVSGNALDHTAIWAGSAMDIEKHLPWEKGSPLILNQNIVHKYQVFSQICQRERKYQCLGNLWRYMNIVAVIQFKLFTTAYINYI